MAGKMKADAKRFVVDASVAIAWCFEDEATDVSERALALLQNGAEVVVPALWPLGVANALLVAQRRRRIPSSNVIALLDRLASFPISLDPTDTTRAFGQVLSVAHQRNLTVYDATYLELASRTALPLATLDKELRRAARSMGVTLI
jgi:uncharacterized protein (TIGR03382 family)